jgi:hypothetical protein
MKVQSKRATHRGYSKSISDEEKLSYRFLPLKVSEVSYGDLYAVVKIRYNEPTINGTEDFAELMWGGKRETLRGKKSCWHQKEFADCNKSRRKKV